MSKPVEIDRRPMFLLSLDDMRKRVAAESDYEWLGLSLLLRKLLLDEAPLLTLVNRGPKLKVFFDVLEPRGPRVSGPALELWIAGVAIDPMYEGQFGARRQLTLLQFLALPVVRARHHKMSIRDVIHYGAHVSGYVHTGAPKTEVDKTMVEVDAWLEAAKKANGVNAPDMISVQLRAIAMVVLKSLADIEATIRSSLAAGDEQPPATVPT